MSLAKFTYSLLIPQNYIPAPQSNNLRYRRTAHSRACLASKTKSIGWTQNADIL